MDQNNGEKKLAEQEFVTNAREEVAKTASRMDTFIEEHGSAIAVGSFVLGLVLMRKNVRVNRSLLRTNKDVLKELQGLNGFLHDVVETAEVAKLSNRETISACIEEGRKFKYYPGLGVLVRSVEGA